MLRYLVVLLLHDQLFQSIDVIELFTRRQGIRIDCFDRLAQRVDRLILLRRGRCEQGQVVKASLGTAGGRPASRATARP